MASQKEYSPLEALSSAVDGNEEDDDEDYYFPFFSLSVLTFSLTFSLTYSNVLYVNVDLNILREVVAQ